MGTLDFLKAFEDRVIDAASYQLLQRNFEMQEQNNKLLSEKCQLLEERLDTLSEDIHELERENKLLKEATTAAQFKEHKGFAFKRHPDGSYDETPYCPNCKVVMGNLLKKSYQCAQCNYLHQSQTRPSVLARGLGRRQDESQQNESTADGTVNK